MRRSASPRFVAPHTKGTEDGLVYVVLLVGGGQDLGLVYVVDFEGLQDLGLHEVPDARLRHHGDGDGLLDLHDLLGVAHPRDPAVGPYVRGHALQGHDGHGPASSAILACSASTTSMMTPPLSIWAIPLLTLKVPVNRPLGHVILPLVSTRICKGYLTTGAPDLQTVFRLHALRSGSSSLSAFFGVFL